MFFAHRPALAVVTFAPVALAVAALAGCPDFVPDPRARIACDVNDDSPDQCPTGSRCEASVARCIPTVRDDVTAPNIVTSVIDPPAGGAGDVISVTFTVDEPLDHAPIVHVGDAPGVAATDSDGNAPAANALAFAYSFSIPDGAAADEGPRAVTIDLVDVFANAASKNIGDVTFVYSTPAKPFLASLLLVQTPTAPEDPASVDGADDQFALSGIAGAIPSSTRARVYADEGLINLVVDDIAVNGDGSFSEVAIPAAVGFDPGDVFVVAVNDAGVESEPVEAALPVFTAIAPAGGAVALGEGEATITFTSSVALDGDPVVTVGGTVASSVALVTPPFLYSATVTLDGSEPEGVDAAVIRVTGSSVLLASGNRGTNGAVVTLDFTPPAIDETKLVLDRRTSPLHDGLAGLAGSVADVAGADVVDASGLSVTVLAAGDAFFIAASPNADGSFAEVDMGDDRTPSFEVRVVDLAQNETTLVVLNDIDDPVIAAVDVDRRALREGAVGTITFTVSDASSSLASLPVVTVGGRAATHVSGGVAVGLGAPVAFSYSLTASEATDIEASLPVVITVVDEGGNTVTTGAGDVVFDYTNPVVNLTVPGVRRTWNGLEDIAGTVDDAGSGPALASVAIRDDDSGTFFDGGAFSSASPLFLDAAATLVSASSATWSRQLPGLIIADGTAYSIIVRGVDLAGNASADVGPFPFTGDRTAPTTRIDTPPPATTTALRQSVAFSCDDGVNGSAGAACTFTCSLDGATAAPCGTPLDTGALALGAHTLRVVATDVAGNVDPGGGVVAAWTVRREFLEIDQANQSDNGLACGISQDTRLWCWGDNRFNILDLVLGNGQPAFLPAPVPIEDVVTGAHDSFGFAHVSVNGFFGSVCASTVDGDLYCFGNNQLGQYALDQQTRPGMQLVSSGGWGKLAAAQVSTCGLRDDGVGDELVCFGNNGAGEAGVGSLAVVGPTPVAAGPAHWRAVSMGQGQGCAVGDDGLIYCWGSQGFGSGALGTNDGLDHDVPTPIAAPAGTHFVDVAQEGFGGCGVTDTGQLLCWGNNSQGQAGQATTTTPVNAPTRVGLDSDWTSVAKGGSTTCGVRNGDHVVCFGGSAFGERGDGAAADDAGSPALKDLGAGFTRVSLGFATSWFGRGDGTTVCTGANARGQCGAGQAGDARSPVVVATGVSDMSLGGRYLQLLVGTSLRAAGTNNGAQRVLQDGSTSRRASFVNGAAGPFGSVSAGEGVTCGLRADATLSCFGDDSIGELGGGAGDQTPGPVTPGLATDHWLTVSAGSGSVCAVRDDHRMFCWGFLLDRSSFVTADAPTALDAATDWESVDIGNDHACGLKINGDAFCWGFEGNGALGNGGSSGVRRGPQLVQGGHTWTHVVAGDGQSCGIDVDGTAWCWGNNQNGQLGDPGVNISINVPNQVPDGPYSDIDVDGDRTCATSFGGLPGASSVSCWGIDFLTLIPVRSPQVIFSGAGPPGDEIIDVDLGPGFACFRTLDSGTVSCIGANDDGELGNGLGFFTTPVAMPEVP